MPATVAGIHLGPDTHANRPAASAPPVGSFYYCSDHDLVYQTDGSSWTTWLDNSAGGLADQGTVTYLDLTEAAAPATPASGKVRWYAKTDGSIASKDDAGTETVHGSGGGGSSAAVACHAKGSTITISNVSWTKLAFADTDLFDPDGLHDPSTNNTRFTADRDGLWRLRIDMFWDGNTGGSRYCRHYKNGTLASGDSNWRDSAALATGRDHAWNREWIFDLVDTDYVEAEVYQDSGGNLDLDAATAIFEFMGTTA